MRELKKAIFGYPIYKVTTTFYYRKVGTPTIFAELLMSLANEFPQLQHNSVGQIARILKLEPGFIYHTLEDMQDIGMFDMYDYEDLDNLMISDLTLTDIGQQFYENKQMPGRRRTTTDDFYFNPLTKKYGKFEKSSKEDISLQPSLFPVNDEQLLPLSKGEVPYQSWFDNDVQVEENGIEHDIKQVGSQAVSVSLHLDDNYYLNIGSCDTLFNDWLNNRSSEILIEYILMPLLKSARDVLDYDVSELEYDDDILSVVLADQLSDTTVVKNAIPIAVKFSGEQSIDKNKPALIFTEHLEQAVLDGKHLSVSFSSDFEGVTQLFFPFDGDDMFMEKIGLLTCYFDRQPIDVPVKILGRQQRSQFFALPEFVSPNQDALIFMANFIAEDELLVKMPVMNVSEAVGFHKKIKETWKKNFMPADWLKKISPIGNEQQLKEFDQYFHHIPLTLSLFSEEMQYKIFDLGIKNEQSPERKVKELKGLFQLYDRLKTLDAEKWVLETIHQDSLMAIQQWQNTCDDLRLNYPQVYSKSLEQMTEKLILWRERVTRLFVISPNKIAVLDTNFIRKHTDKLSDIKLNSRVVLPKIVLDELDYQKERIKEEIDKIKILLQEKEQQYNEELSKVKELNQQIEDVNSEIAAIQGELVQVQLQAKALSEQEQNYG